MEETDGKIRLYGVKQSIQRQLEEFKQNLALQMFESQFFGFIPDEFSITQHFGKLQLEGKITGDTQLSAQLEYVNDENGEPIGFHIKITDADGKDLGI